MECKQCGKGHIVRNGRVRGKQRYRCKDCGYNFIEGDARVKRDTAIKRAFAVILYSLGKASYAFIARLFGVTPPAVQKWLEPEPARLRDPDLSGDIREIELEEMWQFVQRGRASNGPSGRWIALHGEPLPGLSAVVMLQRSGGSMTR
jgi:transposase